MNKYQQLLSLFASSIMIMSILLPATAIAVEDEHKGHVVKQQAPTNHGEHDGPYYGVTPATESDNRLQILDSIPPSGRAREATSDGRYNMESTSVNNDLLTRCAQGSRGLVMLDNETWKKCGGKPEGAAKGAGYYPAIPPWNKAGKGNNETGSGTVDHSMH